MITILTAFTIGAYMSRRSSFTFDADDLSFEIFHASIGTDLQKLRSALIAAWAILSAVVAWIVATGRNCRNYCNAILIPWLGSYGLQLPTVPALRLPQSADSLVDFDTPVARITKVAAKSAA